MRTRTLSLVFAMAAAVAGVACSNPTTPTNVSNVTNKPVNAAPANTNAAPAIAALPGMDEATHAAFKAKCALCHGQDGKGSGKAPNLFTVKDKHTPEQWEGYLKNPRSLEKDNTMPIIPLEDDQRKLLAAWLAKTTGGQSAEKPADMPANKPATPEAKK
ncbi:MAG: cytochrome c [Blastocatellia bacterium]|nr:cytochrome c [Blastocatellia bacterium]MBK6425759.1 cytochrome c [Blastocatellia bacterium]